MKTLTELLSRLEAAVRAGDRAPAIELARQIEQLLVREHYEQDAIERRVRELIAELDQPGSRTLLAEDLPLRADRGASEPESAGVVFPVWFGTNRKPTPQGGGFTGERHNRVTHGRVEVHVPEAHRFGETGTAFWKKLLRFDLRDDNLRVQRIARQERNAFFSEVQAANEAARESDEMPQALCYLHGYNVTFEDAAIRGPDRIRPEGSGRDGVLQLALARQRHRLPRGRSQHRGERAGDHGLSGGLRPRLRRCEGARDRAQYGQPRTTPRTATHCRRYGEGKVRPILSRRAGH